MFALFRDPEGPNLLVVVVAAAIIYSITTAVYLSNFFRPLSGLKRTVVTVIAQIAVAAGFYVLLR